jgi:uncharacterized protein YxeA
MDLKEYIKSNLEHGYSIEQIKQFLVSNGYSENDINLAIQSTNQSQPLTPPNQLENYILNSLRQGYPPKQIFDALIVQGYKEKDVFNIFVKLDKQNYDGQMPFELIHKKNNSTTTKIVITLFIIMLIVLGGYFYMQKFSIDDVEPLVTTTTSDSLSLSATSSSYANLGESIEININVNAQGKSNTIYFDYAFRNTGNVLVNSESDTKIASTNSFKKSILIPENIPEGNYYVEIKATFGSKVQTKKITFAVKTKGAMDSFEDEIDEIEDTTEIEETVPEIVTTQPTATNVNLEKPMSDQEIFDLAMKETDKSLAIGYCNKINYVYLKENCLTTLAFNFDDAGICLYVKQDTDYCYMNFVINGKTELCSKVTQESSKTICLQYQSLQNANQTYVPTPQTPYEEGDINGYDDSDFDN